MKMDKNERQSVEEKMKNKTKGKKIPLFRIEDTTLSNSFHNRF